MEKMGKSCSRVWVLAVAAAMVGLSINMAGVAADIKLSVSYCNVCYNDPNSCQQTYYIHWGDNKLGSCKDSSAPLDDDYKTAYGKVNTPHGAGTYTLINGNAAVDQVKSRITAPDGSVYTCYRANGARFTNYCGATYACSVGLSCYGPA